MGQFSPPPLVCEPHMCVFTLQVYLGAFECVGKILGAGDAAVSKTDEKSIPS